MTICFVADQGYLACAAALREEVERERPGFLSIFLQPSPAEPGAWAPPPADLYLLPASLFLDLEPERRPEPLFAYGGKELILETMSSGCADYLREPLEVEDLEARALRLFSFKLRLGGGSLFCSAERKLAAEAGEVALTEAEFRLFRILALNLNRPVPRPALDYALRGSRLPASRAVDVHIASVRRKLSALLPGAGACLRASRGSGYVLLGTACG